jgi:extracellular factor (EF) 3-hydroxypalmitic acid methyl ester biosynthesis protein
MALELAKKLNGTSRLALEQHFLDDIYEMFIHGQVEEGMNALLPGLKSRRLTSGPQEWAKTVETCLHHPLCELLHQDPFTQRAYAKPRGYAGDAVLLDFIYGPEEGWLLPEGTTSLGRMIFDFTSRSAACEGVRARRGFIADLLDRMVESTQRPHVLSIASGHLREAHLCSAVKRQKMGRLVALDADKESLREVESCYGRFGVETHLGSIRQLLTQKVQLGNFDLVYSTGLYDYLQQPTAQRLSGAMFQMLRPGGRLLVANFLPGISDLGYMESYMGWNLIYRTRQEMVDISSEIPQAAIRDLRIFAEENQNIIFLEITKQ